MDDNTLVRFAAEKVGVSALQNSGAAGGWVRKVGNQVDWDRCFATELLALESLVDLTSPDLFFKGLAAFKDQCLIKKAITYELEMSGLMMMYEWFQDAGADEWLVQRNFKDISEIPQKFWECWVEVEERQHGE